MRTPLSSMLWVILGSFVGSFGAVFLKIGAGHLSGDLKSIFANWRLGLGIAFYLLSSIFFVMGVRQGQLSVLYPMVSLGSIWTLIWSKMLLGEKLTPPKFAAVGMILVGCTLLGLGS